MASILSRHQCVNWFHCTKCEDFALKIASGMCQKVHGRHDRHLRSRIVVNILRPRQNWRHFADDIFKCVFLNENVWFPINISLKFVPRGQINKIPALVQTIAWRRPGDKLLSEPMMVSLPTHICVIQPQWVKGRYDVGRYQWLNCRP